MGGARTLTLGETKILFKYIEIKGIEQSMYEFAIENGLGDIISVKDFIEQNSTTLELNKLKFYAEAIGYNM